MSYCQWEHARSDLEQCVDAFEEEGQDLVDELVKDKKNGYPHEYDSFIALREMAEKFIEMFDAHDVPMGVEQEVDR